MPKRVNNIFDKKVKFTYMYNAYKRASAGKHSNKEIILYELDLATNLVNLLKEIYTGNYKQGIYRRFIIYEPKERIILALPFKDRVIHQWYVEEFIKPIFVPKMIEDSYACLENKGVHKASKKIQSYMKKEYKKNTDFYILKCDISKFFYSIDKQRLFNIIKRYVKDIKFLELTKRIIFDGTGKKGIPIGNYTSQYFANIYLNELDHYIKEKLNVKYYVRYMDDFVMIMNDKDECKKTKQLIEEFLNKNLDLKLNCKTSYFKHKQGLSFCGYRIFVNKIILKNANKKKIYKRIKEWNRLYREHNLNTIEAVKSLNSWLGHASHSNSYLYTKKIINKCDWIYKPEIM